MKKGVTSLNKTSRKHNSVVNGLSSSSGCYKYVGLGVDPKGGFGADTKGTLEPPKSTVPFGKGLARTLACVSVHVCV